MAYYLSIQPLELRSFTCFAFLKNNFHSCLKYYCDNLLIRTSEYLNHFFFDEDKLLCSIFISLKITKNIL